MSHRPLVYVFFNVGGGHEKLNMKMRRALGDVYLVLIFPKNYVPSAVEKRGADEVYLMRSRLGLPALLRAVRDIRRQRADFLLIQYDSLKLRVFAALLRPKQCLWWRSDGHIVPLPAGLPATLWELSKRRLRGVMSLLRIYRNIHHGRFNVPPS